VLDAQGSAMTVVHSHVGAIPVEADECFGALGESRMVIASHTHVRLEARKAARAASEALWNHRRQLRVVTLREERRLAPRDVHGRSVTR
jgi:hypothetical protein